MILYLCASPTLGPRWAPINKGPGIVSSTGHRVDSCWVNWPFAVWGFFRRRKQPVFFFFLTLLIPERMQKGEKPNNYYKTLEKGSPNPWQAGEESLRVLTGTKPRLRIFITTEKHSSWSSCLRKRWCLLDRYLSKVGHQGESGDRVETGQNKRWGGGRKKKRDKERERRRERGSGKEKVVCHFKKY